jgi:hypothetical protein
LPFQANGALDHADAAIIPQGIFEKIDYQQILASGTHTNVRVHTALLQERQKQVFNMIGDGKWVCFLVGSIIDKVPQGDWDSQEIDDTELCKKILNALDITKHRRQTVDGLAIFNTKRDEFRTYLRDYGVVNTLFELPYDGKEQFRIIAESDSGPVAIDWVHQTEGMFGVGPSQLLDLPT